MRAAAPCTRLPGAAEGCGRESGLGSARALKRADSDTSYGREEVRVPRASGG